MDRRHFLKKLPVAVGAPFLLNGVALQPMFAHSKLSQAARMSANDRAMVIIQLHGGNDGLNAVIPVNQYSDYYNLRPNLAIPDSGSRRFITLDPTLPSSQQVGLHPDMVGVKELYDQGRVSILQNVGYENMNGSHFKGRDIWFGGVGYNDPVTSGWIGRYLELAFKQEGYQFPQDSPNPDRPDPLGLEFSNEVSLGFHTEDTVPAAISIPNPATFFDFVSGLEGYNEEIKIDPRGFPPEAIADSLYGEELNWILGIEQGTDKYAQRLQTAYKSGDAFKSGVNYPKIYPLAAPNGSLNNPLSRNLEIIAKLLQGGCQTKVFLIRMGGFDTHVNQVENYDNTLGNHAALLYHVSSAMKAFQDDLKARSLDGRVLTVTLSEFGRRAKANGSYGSDHGTVAPMFVFGNGINPGVIGNSPDLSKIENHGGNLSDRKEDITDYRVVFSTILQDWLEVPAANIPVIFPGLGTNNQPAASDKVPLFGRVTALDEFVRQRFRLDNCQPNPVRTQTTIPFYINTAAHVTLILYDLRGKQIRVLLDEYKPAGEHMVTIDLTMLPSGTYLYRVDAGLLKDTRKLMKM